MGISKEAPAKAGSYAPRKDSLGSRLARIEGQVRGIKGMVADEAYCVDVLTQIAAVRAALDRVALAVLQDHVNGCVARAMDADEGSEAVEELLEVVERFVALRK